MRLSAVSTTFGLLVLLGCAGIGAPVPEEGDYIVDSRITDVSDACLEVWQYSPEDNEELEVEVEVSDDEIEFVDYFSCEREGAAFDCEEREEQSADDFDALMVSELVLVGEFTSATTFEADFEWVLSCEGDDCGELSNDCVMEASWEGELDD